MILVEIKLLLEIFPSGSVFAKSHRQMLSERLIKKLDYECDDDIRHVEILKERLGEQEMSLSEIMMKDFADSRRITNSYHSKSKSSVFSALVMSKHYWPAADESKLKVPQLVLDSMGEYLNTFGDIYTSRELSWMPDTGLVDISIHLEGQEKADFQVSPLHASIIHILQDQEEITIEEMAITLDCRKELIKKACLFWESSKILSIFGNIVVSNDFSGIGKYKKTEIDMEVDDSIAEKEFSTSNNIDYIWPFLQGMLQNLGSLETTRIHQTLSMFNSDIFNYRLKQDELTIALETLVTKEKLEVDGGKYKLKKK